ncbi:MAG: gephyrin-like molybdotransferase Glp [Myxococcota bacterium]
MSQKPQDVRMKGFSARVSVREAEQAIEAHIPPRAVERIPFQAALGRSLAAPIRSDRDVPAFDKSAMDGYAVRAVDLPGTLEVVGEQMAKDRSDFVLGAGQAVRVMTGAAIPSGATAVVMVEDTTLEGSRVRIEKTSASGAHILARGEDLRRDGTVLAPPRRLRPQDISMLATVGCLEVPVFQRPRVRIVPTGNELVPIGSSPSGSEIVESNSFLLKALAERDGAEVELHPIVGDDAALLERVLQRPGADLIVVTGGSSVGKQDLGPVVLREAGSLVFHGVQVKPASPTGFGLIAGTPVLLAPGFPVASFVAWDLFGRAIVERMLGLVPRLPYALEEVRLAHAIEKPEGRVDLVRVILGEAQEGRRLASAIPGGAALLSTTTRADGFLLLPAGRARFAAGELIAAHLY